MLLKNPDARARKADARHVQFACAPGPAFDAGLFAELHAARCTISVDTGWHEFWLTDPRNYAMLSEADVFFPNEREAALMTGRSDPEEMLDELRCRGVRNVALKLGAKGAVLSWRGELIWRPRHPVASVDTTGAGDCFDAGFIYAWLNGESPEYCLPTACVCGAMATRGLGGIATFPVKEELDEALDTVWS